MKKTRAIALFVAVAGSLLYLKTVYFSPAKNWEDYNQAGLAAYGKKDYAEAEKQLAAALKEAEKFPLGDSRLTLSLNNLMENISGSSQIRQSGTLYQAFSGDCREDLWTRES